MEAGGSLSGTRFWSAVAAARRDPDIAEDYRHRIAEIDRRAFENSVKIRVPFWLGQSLLIAGVAAGAAAVGISYYLEGLPRDLVFLGGFGALLVGTHSPTHVLAGRLFGMRFTHYFLGGPPPPRPGAKLDYASYLKVPARRRAVMHASAAVLTKLLPFALIPSALAAETSGWVVWLLVALGVIQIITDAAISTKNSDWKRAIREWRAGSAGT